MEATLGGKLRKLHGTVAVDVEVRGVAPGDALRTGHQAADGAHNRARGEDRRRHHDCEQQADRLQQQETLAVQCVEDVGRRLRRQHGADHAVPEHDRAGHRHAHGSAPHDREGTVCRRPALASTDSRLRRIAPVRSLPPPTGSSRDRLRWSPRLRRGGRSPGCRRGSGRLPGSVSRPRQSLRRRGLLQRLARRRGLERAPTLRTLRGRGQGRR